MAHENADFDAVAAQLAAHKLFPEGVPLLSNRVNHNVEQFLALYWDKFPFRRRQNWHKRRVDRLLLVDTQTYNSVRGMSPKVQVQVIDHHKHQSQHEGWHYELAEVGATTTMLVEKLQIAGIGLTPEEATLLLLGIHEDTGSLTYDSTTGRDIRAAAWLLEQGGALAALRRYLHAPLTPAQYVLYEQLQDGAEWLTVKGQPHCSSDGHSAT